jgi:hypothetical protein
MARVMQKMKEFRLEYGEEFKSRFETYREIVASEW